MTHWTDGDRPRLLTPRLLLRPFTADDAARVRELAGDERVADTTLTVPHPYPDGLAEEWIATHEPEFRAGRLVNLALTLRETGELVGAMSIKIQPGGHAAELGYWIGVPYWNRGYATEAARALLRYGFDVVGVYRIHARYVTRNPASARVMEKVGMQFEGVHRAATEWHGHSPPPPGHPPVEDMGMYAMLRVDDAARELPPLELADPD